MDIKSKTEILQTTPPSKTLQMKPQVINRLQSNEYHWFLFITSIYKAKCIRWASILVFSQLDFQHFHQVFLRNIRIAWQPSLVLALVDPCHRRITQTARLISSPKTARSLSHNHRRNEGPTDIIESDDD